MSTAHASHDLSSSTSTPLGVASTGGPHLPRQRLKDQFWVKAIKWRLYKRRFGHAGWSTRYLFDKMVRQLTPADTVIDCGANVGLFTRMLAERGSTVHAFEPDPYSFSRLKQNTSDLPNVVLHNAAVGTCEGSIKLYRKPGFDDSPESASLSSSVFADKVNIDPNSYVEVQQIDFLAFMKELGSRVAILKIDIEGAEVPLLEAMLEDGSLQLSDATFVETHESRVPELADRTAALRRLAETDDWHGLLHLDWE
ncbi:Methyltransferase domain protein [Pseudobythopirellula maris]|uniref:Methyltransferase domain protein n=1 Tax=Pseudobythopirellula maris TaxID=2527991 RepID=A0A5C5ZH09_9BACT|nr:FkbM family methyltransferase [Pseudobythopirellula maris]TWT86604.1 Methyltransferase domain protein [Pseudobythopirellula maris]